MICWKLGGFLSDNGKTFFAAAILPRCFGERVREGQGSYGPQLCYALDAEFCRHCVIRQSSGSSPEHSLFSRNQLFRFHHRHRNRIQHRIPR